jgi:hypothetical protein
MCTPEALAMSAGELMLCCLLAQSQQACLCRTVFRLGKAALLIQLATSSISSILRVHASQASRRLDQSAEVFDESGVMP